MKDIYRRGPYLSCKRGQLCLAPESLQIPPLPPPLKGCWFCLWLGPILCFYTAFLCQSSYFFSLAWAMVGHFSALLLFSVLLHCWQFEFELEFIWPVWNRYCACAREGHWGCQQHAQEWLTLIRHFPRLWLVVLIQEQWILAHQIMSQLIMPILANVTTTTTTTKKIK